MSSQAGRVKCGTPRAERRRVESQAETHVACAQICGSASRGQLVCGLLVPVILHLCIYAMLLLSLKSSHRRRVSAAAGAARALFQPDRPAIHHHRAAPAAVTTIQLFVRHSSSSLVRYSLHQVPAVRSSCLLYACMSSSSSSKGKGKGTGRSSSSAGGGGAGPPALAAERQKTLNKFLGLPLEQRQTRVDSLFRKQERSLSTTTSGAAASVMSGEAASSKEEPVAVDASSDVEMTASTSSKANGACVLDRLMQQTLPDFLTRCPPRQARSDAS